MKRIRERSRSCVALSKKLLPGISFSLAKRRGISPPSRGNFSFSPHYLYARFGYLPEFSVEMFHAEISVPRLHLSENETACPENFAGCCCTDEIRGRLKMARRYLYFHRYLSLSKKLENARIEIYLLLPQNCMYTF